MSTSDIINIVFVVLSVILGFLSIYFKANGKIKGTVAKYINEAEETYTSLKSGGVKLQFVVGKLYSLLPTAIRPFIPESVIQTIVQAIFNEIDAYATKQVDKVVDRVLPTEKEETESLNK